MRHRAGWTWAGGPDPHGSGECPAETLLGGRHFPIQVQTICQEWKNNFKQPRCIHFCAFGITAWLSSMGSSGYQPCCSSHSETHLIIIWETSKPCPTAHKMLLWLLEQGFLDVVDGSTLLCLICPRAWIQFTAQLHTLTQEIIPVCQFWNTGLWTAKICWGFQHTQMHRDPPPWGPFYCAFMCLVQQNFSHTSLWGVGTKEASGRYYSQGFS